MLAPSASHFAFPILQGGTNSGGDEDAGESSVGKDECGDAAKLDFDKSKSVHYVGGKEVVVYSRLNFLTEIYVENCFYWEIVEMLRKLAVSVVAIFVSHETGANMLLTCFISVCYMQALSTFKPYVKPLDGCVHVPTLFRLLHLSQFYIRSKK